MDRATLKATFGATGPVVTPVIHTLTTAQAERNVRVALGEGAHGVFLINHDFEEERLVPIIRDIRASFPDLWLGVNFLGVTGAVAFPMLAELQAQDCPVDAYWADDARIDERAAANAQEEAQSIDAIRAKCGWRGLYFGGTAFKKQRVVNARDYPLAAALAAAHMDVVTTSGVATGKEVDSGKVAAFRDALGTTALALASGVTPENATRFSDVDCFLVATGINVEEDFYNIAPEKLKQLMHVTQNGNRS